VVPAPVVPAPVVPPACDPESEQLSANSKSCECKPGFVSKDGKCIPEANCDPVSQNISNDRLFCKCKPGFVSKNGRCLPEANCNPETQVISSDRLFCNCKEGYISDATGNCIPKPVPVVVPLKAAPAPLPVPTCDGNGIMKPDGRCGCDDPMKEYVPGQGCVQFCPIGMARHRGNCKPIGRLLSALIKKCIYTDAGRKLDERMYLDLFGEAPSNKFIDTGLESPSGISIRNIYSDTEYQYHEFDGPGSFKAIKIAPNDILSDRIMVNNLTRLSNGDKVEGAIKSIADFFVKKGGPSDRIVALFFNIALVIYSLYYKKEDGGSPERINMSLRNVYYSTLKPFMRPTISGVAGNNDEQIINTFIKYYNAGLTERIPGSKQTARLGALRNKRGGKPKTHRSNTQKRKHNKYNKTRKHKNSKNSKTIKRRSKKQNTRRK
jgi:hypothetical protein